LRNQALTLTFSFRFERCCSPRFPLCVELEEVLKQAYYGIEEPVLGSEAADIESPEDDGNGVVLIAQ